MPASEPLTNETILNALSNELHTAISHHTRCSVAEQAARSELHQKEQERLEAEKVVDRLRLAIAMIKGRGSVNRNGTQLIGDVFTAADQ